MPRRPRWLGGPAECCARREGRGSGSRGTRPYERSPSYYRGKLGRSKQRPYQFKGNGRRGELRLVKAAASRTPR